MLVCICFPFSSTRVPPNPIPSSSSPFPPPHPQSLHVNNALIATPHYWQPSFSFSLSFFPLIFLTNLASSSSLGNLKFFFSNFIVNNLVSLSLGNLILPGGSGLGRWVHWGRGHYHSFHWRLIKSIRGI